MNFKNGRGDPILHERVLALLVVHERAEVLPEPGRARTAGFRPKYQWSMNYREKSQIWESREVGKAI